ncbi:cupin domain-containing protein [Actinocorallia longicatena]|uniref:Cupin type-2 domain-containing protein n=1 Tax=Actinocorallia longicatena TaxID=111803 RepID=A0ABP6Q821_9ACTN
MTLATSAAATVIDNGDFVMTPLAVPSRGSVQLAMWTVTATGPSRSPVHSVDHEEVFYVQSGTFTATIDGVEHTAGPGDALMCPPGVPFFLASGEEGAVVVAVTTAGMKGMLNGNVISPPWAR